MSTNLLRIASLALLFAISAAIDARGQFDFTALQGLPTAQAEASSTLGADAYPVLIGAPGDFEFQSFPLTFDLESGRSSLWGYVFFSPSKQEFASFVVVRVIAYQAFAFGSLPFPVPAENLGRLNVSGQHADSDKMILRLETDTAYQKYRSDLPGAKPTFLSLTRLIESDSLDLPNGFPAGQGTWTVSFQGGGDSTMTCFVASETGEAFCRRIYGLPTSAVHDPVASSTGAAPALTVAPNPAKGEVSIVLAGATASQFSSCRLLLYNDAGALMLDLTESFRAGNHSRASFAASPLPSGNYHCLLVGPGVSQHAGVVVVE